MRPYAYREFLRRLPLLFEPANVLPDLLLNASKEEEMFLKLVRHPDAREVFVTPPVAKPPTHLEQGVVGPSTSNEVADDQSLEREPSGERVATNRDHHAGVIR